MQSASVAAEHSFQFEDAPTYLTGVAAVASVVSIAASQLLMGLAILALISTRTKLRVPPIWVPLALFFCGTLLSEAASGHARAGWPQDKKFYVYLMLFLVVSAFRTVAQVRWVVMGWAAAASLSSIWSLDQFARKYQAAKAAHADFYTYYVGGRITGFMSHWMTFSGEMMMALMMLGALVFFCRDRRGIAWFVAAGAVVSVGLLAAFTRSMWLGAVGGAIYLIWIWKRWMLFAIPALAGVLLLANPFAVRERAVSAFEPHGDLDSNEHRAVLRRVGWEMIKAHPWLGVGPEEVGPQFQQYIPPDVPRPLPTGYYGHLHNIYYHYAAERGVPTMLALMWMLGQALFDFARRVRRLPPKAEERWVLHGAIAAMIAVLIGGFYEVNLGDSEVLGMFLAVLGCGYVVIMQRDLEENTSAERGQV
jgi:O-antigen ligase